MTQVAIIGGGIGGLVAGIALRKAGVDVTIYERAPAFGEVGAGISMSPNAVLGLNSLGLGVTIRSLADQPLEQNQHHAHTGELLLSIDRRGTEEKYGAPYLQLHRADLMAMLLSAFDPENCRMGHELVEIDSRTDGVTLTFATGETIEAEHDLCAPLPLPDRATKLRGKARALLGDAVFGPIWSAITLAESPDLAELTRCLSGRVGAEVIALA